MALDWYEIEPPAGILARRRFAAVLVAVLMLAACTDTPNCIFADPDGRPTALTGYGDACAK
jgi:hypothetical protein